MIEKSIKNGIRMYQKRPRTDKNKSTINTSNKIISAIKIFKSMINNDELRIPGEYYAKPYNNSSVKWGLLMHSRSGFFKFLTTLKLLKTTKITISQKTPFFKITKK